MKTKCCNYEIDPARPVVMWNEHNGVVQCHNCGHVYEPALAGVDSSTWPIVLWFAGEMEKKLEANRHKGDAEGWRMCSPFTLLDRLREETGELSTAMDLIPPADPAVFPKIIAEAADVANFAMMIADQADEALKKGLGK
jgi:NTP pyrophosphatase (non-canonical NTP hydrolase)